MSDDSPDPDGTPSTGHEFESHHRFRGPLPRRRLLFADFRAAHRSASDRLRGIDGEIEALVARRRVCLSELDALRTKLNRRYSRNHIRRSAWVDEAPVPPAPVAAEPLGGIDLRAVCLTILRRHGPQRLRDLHGLLHCYGYVVDGVRPVQRLGDAMAYELRCGRARRVERGTYEAVGDAPPPAPAWGTTPSVPSEPLPWCRPQTEPGPPHVDPAVAQDPEHWSAGRWPDPPEASATPAQPEADQPPTDGGAAEDAPVEDAPTSGATGKPAPSMSGPSSPGDDSSTNRPRGPDETEEPSEPEGISESEVTGQGRSGVVDADAGTDDGRDPDVDGPADGEGRDPDPP